MSRPDDPRAGDAPSKRARFARRDGIVRLAALLLALAGVKRVLLQSRELVAGTSHAAAFDLHLRWVEASRWLAGLPVYETTHTNYPPATYAVLAPLIGWLEWPTLRAVWLVLCLSALAAISFLAARTVTRPDARALAAVLPWATYGTALTIGVGQLGLPSLAFGLGAVLLARRPGGTPSRAVLVGELFALSLVKPTLTVPWFFVLALAAPLAAAVAATLYAAGTVAALASQPEPWSRVFASWIENTKLHMGRGYGSIADAAVLLGHRWLALPLGLVLLALYGAWTFRHRRADVWLLLGVGAVVARVFTYHYYVDDLLAMVPLVALLRVASGALAAPPRVGRAAAVTLAAAIAAELLPTRLFDDYGSAVTAATEVVHVLEWLAMATVLCWAAGGRAPRRESTATDARDNLARAS